MNNEIFFGGYNMERIKSWKEQIESTIEDEPEKMTALISVNNILNDIENLSTKKIADYVSEELTNKLFEEVKNSIGLKEE